MNPPSIPQSLPPLLKLDPSRLLHILNSKSSFSLPTTDSMLYSKTMRNFIALSILSNLSTSPTTVSKKFESNRNNLLLASSNLPSTKDSSNVSNLWYEKYANKSPFPTNISSFVLFLELLKIPRIPWTRSFACTAICRS